MSDARVGSLHVPLETGSGKLLGLRWAQTRTPLEDFVLQQITKEDLKLFYRLRHLIRQVKPVKLNPMGLPSSLLKPQLCYSNDTLCQGSEVCSVKLEYGV